MPSPFIAAAPIGAFITALLILAMHSLIAMTPMTVQAKNPRTPVVFVRTVRDEDTHKIPDVPVERIPPPIQPPSRLRSAYDAGTGAGPAFPTVADPGPGPTSAMPAFGLLDGSLINLVRAQPNYPGRALALGLEGYATVSFDVNETGLVENVVVVASSNPIFDKAAIDAALRFRYRPPVVDGEPRRVTGIVNRFVFRIDE